MLKSGTLSSAAPVRHSQNREWRRSATPFYQKERCGSGPQIFEVSENMSGPLFSLFLGGMNFLQTSFFPGLPYLQHTLGQNNFWSSYLILCAYILQKKSSILLNSRHDWLIERSCENLDASKFISDFINYFTSLRFMLEVMQCCSYK